MKAIIGNKILTRKGIEPGCIIIEDGVIKDVLKELPKSFTGTAEDMGDLLVMPGIVDPHVHINEPGRTEWEGFDTATRAAAAGGITTVVDMPLNCDPVTTSKKALQEKIKHVRERLWVDVGFWGGATPDSLEDLPELIGSGVLGVKSFLIDSGLPDFQPMDTESLNEAVEIMAKAKLPYLIHAELNRSIGAPPIEITQDYKTFLKSRPRKWENDAIDLLINLSRLHKCKIHIVHLSSSDRLGELHDAKRNGIPITVETCPHYLTISSDAITAGKTLYKCCPPIREESNKEKLWDGLLHKTIDFIASDHSPCTPALKCIEEGDLARAWGGISSLQLSLPLIWTEAKKRKIGVELVSEWMSSKPAEFAGLRNKKGEISKGYDADLVVWDPEEEFKVTRSIIYHKHQETPYLGRTLKGKVHKTFVRGFKVFDHGRFSSKALGETILKEKKKWPF